MFGTAEAPEYMGDSLSRIKTVKTDNLRFKKILPKILQKLVSCLKEHILHIVLLFLEDFHRRSEHGKQPSSHDTDVKV